MKLPTLEFPWYVIRAKAGSEHLAADELRVGGYQAYLPCRRRRRFKRRQRIFDEYHEALMPGYLFLAESRQIDWGLLRNELTYPHVGRPLRGHDGPLRIPARLVVQINIDEIAGLFDETGATKKANHAKLVQRFPRGSKHRVEEGAFIGFDALVECVTPKERIKALVEIFGRMVAVEFEVDQLEAA